MVVLPLAAWSQSGDLTCRGGHGLAVSQTRQRYRGGEGAGTDLVILVPSVDTRALAMGFGLRATIAILVT
jgi:hypothetical protein